MELHNTKHTQFKTLAFPFRPVKVRQFASTFVLMLNIWNLNYAVFDVWTCCVSLRYKVIARSRQRHRQMRWHDSIWKPKYSVHWKINRYIIIIIFPPFIKSISLISPLKELCWDFMVTKINNLIFVSTPFSHSVFWTLLEFVNIFSLQTLIP